MGKAGAPPILFDPILITLVVEGLTLHRVSWTLLTSLHQSYLLFRMLFRFLLPIFLLLSDSPMGPLLIFNETVFF